MNPTAGSFTIDPRLQVGRTQTHLGQLQESRLTLANEKESIDLGLWGSGLAFPGERPSLSEDVRTFPVGGGGGVLRG